MKAKRRHELKTNELAQTLIDAREFLQRRSRYVFGGVAVALLVLVVGTVWVRSTARARSEAWRTFYDLRSGTASTAPDRLERVRALGQRTNDRTLARLALHLEARVAWDQVRQEGELDTDAIEAAEDAYQRTLSQFPDDPYSVGGALRGLAAVAEERAALASSPSDRQAQIDRAREHYQRILDDERLSQAPVRTVAESQLATLNERLQPVEIVEAPAEVPTLLERPDAATTLPVATAPTTQPVAAPAETPSEFTTEPIEESPDTDASTPDAEPESTSEPAPSAPTAP